MKFFKKTINFILVFIGMMGFLALIPLVFGVVNGDLVFWIDAKFPIVVFIIISTLGFLVNLPPKEAKLREYYIRKWLISFSLIFISVVCLPLLTNENISAFGSFGFELRRLPESLGELFVLVLFFTLISISYFNIWRCPGCSRQLFMVKLKSDKNVKLCPYCSVKLAQS